MERIIIIEDKNNKRVNKIKLTIKSIVFWKMKFRIVLKQVKIINLNILILFQMKNKSLLRVKKKIQIQDKLKIKIISMINWYFSEIIIIQVY